MAPIYHPRQPEGADFLEMDSPIVFTSSNYYTGELFNKTADSWLKFEVSQLWILDGHRERNICLDTYLEKLSIATKQGQPPKSDSANLSSKFLKGNDNGFETTNIEPVSIISKEKESDFPKNDLSEKPLADPDTSSESSKTIAETTPDFLISEKIAEEMLLLDLAKTIEKREDLNSYYANMETNDFISLNGSGTDVKSSENPEVSSDCSLMYPNKLIETPSSNVKVNSEELDGIETSSLAELSKDQSEDIVDGTKELPNYKAISKNIWLSADSSENSELKLEEEAPKLNDSSKDKPFNYLDPVWKQRSEVLNLPCDAFPFHYDHGFFNQSEISKIDNYQNSTEYFGMSSRKCDYDNVSNFTWGNSSSLTSNDYSLIELLIICNIWKINLNETYNSDSISKNCLESTESDFLKLADKISSLPETTYEQLIFKRKLEELTYWSYEMIAPKPKLSQEKYSNDISLVCVHRYMTKEHNLWESD